MKIVTLIENTEGHHACTAEHGLSIYIETEKHKLLMDTGQTDAVVKNAAALGIDLSAVDTVILSHGHYDHSGGIMPFSELNKNAVIIMQKEAPEDHYNGDRFIGMDKKILDLPNLKILDGDLKIDDELFLFTGVTGRRCFPQGNFKLTRVVNGERVYDNFAHEQCLVISQNGKKILLSGCAHNGILNILDHYRTLFGNAPDYVITGFHMMKRDGEHTDAEKATIVEVAKELSQTKTIFYSGHCTGIPAFEMMKEIMGDRLHAMHTGEAIELSL